MIGGLIFWNPTDLVGTASALRAMASRAAGVRATVSAEQGSVGLFGTATSYMESTERLRATADWDLTNLSDLQALVNGTDRDTGLLESLYRLEGPQFLCRLRGAFALAVWDPRQRSLLLAVDRFGMRRLYYVSDGQRVAFASRPSALLAAPNVEKKVDLATVYNYLNFGYVPAPSSIFAGIRRLEPGQCLLLGPARMHLEHYWNVSYSEARTGKSQAAATLYRATEDAVREALRDTIAKETGAFLSGGTDSSAVVGLMSGLTGERVNAFSVGFETSQYDERSYADLTARHFGAAHYTHVVKPDEALSVLPRLVEAYDEPFGNNSMIGTFFAAQLARECGIRQLLAGDGGDEIFGGNERYRTDRIFARYHQIPSVIRRHLVEPILLPLANPPGTLGKAQRYIRRANIPNPRRFYSYEFFFTAEGHGLLSPEMTVAVDAGAPVAVLERHYADVQAASELNRLLYLDLKLTLGDNDLLKVTRTAELAAVGVRFPLLDTRLVDLMNSLPVSYKVRGLDKRHLFKHAFRPLLPPATLAKRKHGFGVPTSVWLKSSPAFRDMARDVLLSPRARQRGYFRHGAIESLFRQHTADTTSYYGDILWTVLMLELWQRRHVDRPREVGA
jgi:asparagine synthase (glutamine-hydrolysing)